MAIVDASSLLKPLYPSLTWQMKPADQEVYLTFDDGPHPQITGQILDILREYRFKATFFTVGQNMERFPEMCDRVVREGHVLGNHTYSHVSGYKCTAEEYQTEAGAWSPRYETTLFRPPYGRITRKQIQVLRNDYTIVMWTLLSWDFQQGLDQKGTLRKLKRGTKSGSIIVFHDSIKAERNVLNMLPEYCHFLREEGYRSEVLRIPR